MTIPRISLAALFFMSSTSFAISEITVEQANVLLSNFLDTTRCFDALVATNSLENPVAPVESRFQAMALTFFLDVHSLQSGDSLEAVADDFILWCEKDRSSLVSDFRKN